MKGTRWGDERRRDGWGREAGKGAYVGENP